MNPKALIGLVAILCISYGIYMISSAHTATKQSDKILDDFNKVNASLHKIDDSLKMKEDSIKLKYDTSLIRIKRQVSR